MLQSNRHTFELMSSLCTDLEGLEDGFIVISAAGHLASEQGHLAKLDCLRLLFSEVYKVPNNLIFFPNPIFYIHDFLPRNFCPLFPT